jgi:hypothetical protein
MEAATAEAPPWLCSRAGQDPEVLRAPGTVDLPVAPTNVGSLR